MLAHRSLLVLCLGLLLCCESLPNKSFTNMRLSTPPSNASNQTLNNTNGVVLQSIFISPEICKEGFKLVGDPQRCRKIA